MGIYLWHYGLGAFLSTAGIVFSLISILVFIFFLSIDPGYGWSKSKNLHKNYIMISGSISVCVIGVILFVIGQRLNAIETQANKTRQRCQDIRNGKTAEVLKEDWYKLRDEKIFEGVRVSLFQKKDDEAQYKIIAAVSAETNAMSLRKILISSQAMATPIALVDEDLLCPEVFEKNIVIPSHGGQERVEQIKFDVLVRYTSGGDSTIESAEETYQCRLQNDNKEGAGSSEGKHSNPQAYIAPLLEVIVLGG